MTPAEEAVSAAIERLLADPRPRASITAEARALVERRRDRNVKTRSRRGLLSGPRPNVRRRSQFALCGDGSRAAVRQGWLRVCRCGSCGLVQVGAARADELEQIYGEEYFSSEVFHDYVAEREDPGPGRPGCCSDACTAGSSWKAAGRRLAAGFFLEAASAHYEATGVELSPFASSYARETFGLRVFTGDVSDGTLNGERFDVVTVWNTIEHMADPLGAFTVIGRIMPPGAPAGLSTGDVTGPWPFRSSELEPDGAALPSVSSSRRRRSTCSWRRPASSCVASSTTASSPRAGRSLEAGTTDGNDGGSGKRYDRVRDPHDGLANGSSVARRLAARYRPLRLVGVSPDR